MTPLQLLQQAYQNVCQNLANITANPKPSYSVDGVSYSWNEYQSMLLESRAKLKSAIQDEQCPFWVVSQLRT